MIIKIVEYKKAYHFAELEIMILEISNILISKIHFCLPLTLIFQYYFKRLIQVLLVELQKLLCFIICSRSRSFNLSTLKEMPSRTVLLSFFRLSV